MQVLGPGRNPIPFLRKCGIVEGISFLMLLGVAMPLKYLAGQPMAVTVVGWVHGLLVVILCGALLVTLLVAKWPIGRAALVFVAALVPLGPFLIDGKLKQWQAEFEAHPPL